MYDWELSDKFKEHNYSFSFYDFHLIQKESPQIRYSLLWENEKEKCLTVWSTVNNDSRWEIIIS